MLGRNHREHWKRLLALGAMVSFALVVSTAEAKRECKRNVAVRAENNASNSAAKWNDRVLLRLLKKSISVAGVNVPASPPDYVITGTLRSKGEGTTLSVALGFLGGDPIELPFWKGYIERARAAYYGTLILVEGWTRYGNENPQDFSSDISQMFDSEGGLLRMIRNYENIPTTARAELDVKCVSPGETREIQIRGLESPYEAPKLSSVFVRLLAEAEKGTIRNGTKLVSGDAKVFVERAARFESAGPVLQYTAPSDDDLAKDVIRVHNSCEIRDEEHAPLRKTPKKDEILEFDVPICKSKRELEYNHRMTITHSGSKLTYQVKGSVPFVLKNRGGAVLRGELPDPKEGEEPIEVDLEGAGTVSVSMKGQAGGRCSMKYTSTMRATIGGKAKYENDLWFLYPEISEDYAKMFTMTMTCRKRTMTQKMKLPAPPVHYPADKLQFRDLDGKTISGPFQGPGGHGTYELILHVPNLDASL